MQWDDELADEQLHQWKEWKDQPLELEQVVALQCIVPNDVTEPTNQQLYVFSDASTISAVAWVTFCDGPGNISVKFVTGKARVTPLSVVSIPCLNITAATFSDKIGTYLDNLKID